MKYFGIGGVVVVAVLISMSLFSKDEYVGFFYPDSTNLSVDIMSDEIFDTIEQCRVWVDVMLLEYASEMSRNGYTHDYECGKNCKISGGKPYICESTLR